MPANLVLATSSRLQTADFSLPVSLLGRKRPIYPSASSRAVIRSRGGSIFVADLLPRPHLQTPSHRGGWATSNIRSITVPFPPFGFFLYSLLSGLGATIPNLASSQVGPLNRLPGSPCVINVGFILHTSPCEWKPLIWSKSHRK